MASQAESSKATVGEETKNTEAEKVVVTKLPAVRGIKLNLKFLEEGTTSLLGDDVSLFAAFDQEGSPRLTRTQTRKRKSGVDEQLQSPKVQPRRRSKNVKDEATTRGPSRRDKDTAGKKKVEGASGEKVLGASDEEKVEGPDEGASRKVVSGEGSQGGKLVAIANADDGEDDAQMRKEEKDEKMEEEEKDENMEKGKEEEMDEDAQFDLMEKGELPLEEVENQIEDGELVEEEEEKEAEEDKEEEKVAEKATEEGADEDVETGDYLPATDVEMTERDAA